MRILSTRIHGALDYVIGAVLVLAPWLFGFAVGGPVQWVPILIGVGVIVYSTLTAYEMGFMPVISMPVHLMLDVAAGVVLALSPWLFGFAQIIVWPHLLVGLLAIGGGLMTETQPAVVGPTTTRAGD